MLNSRTRTRIYQILLSEPSLSLDEIRTSLAKQGLPINKLMLISILFGIQFNCEVSAQPRPIVDQTTRKRYRPWYFHGFGLG